MECPKGFEAKVSVGTSRKQLSIDVSLAIEPYYTVILMRLQPTVKFEEFPYIPRARSRLSDTVTNRKAKRNTEAKHYTVLPLQVI
jgi:hypothetical protein